MSTDFVKRIFETCFITVGAFGTPAEVLTACSRRSGSTVRRSVGSELNCTPGKRGGTGKASWGGRGYLLVSKLTRNDPMSVYQLGIGELVLYGTLYAICFGNGNVFRSVGA